MISFQNDYLQRVNEISTYFSFLEYIDKVETHKRIPLSYSNNEYLVNRDLQKIFRANSYLLLYNLIESTVRNSIQLLHDKIHDNDLKFDDSSERIQEIWIGSKIKSIPVSDSKTKSWLKNILCDYLKNIEFSNIDNSINISGNLDYENMQLIINRFGFFGKINTSKIDLTKTFEKVKFERNKLAHGNKRFCQTGEIITINELITLKDIIISFLNDYTTNVINYMTQKKYLK